MEFIPIEPDENLASFLNSAQQFPFVFVEINNPGDYENENIVFKANEDIDSLNDYLVLYIVEDTATGIPDYSKCRVLTFDDIELQKGDLLQIYTCSGNLEQPTFLHRNNSAWRLLHRRPSTDN